MDAISDAIQHAQDDFRRLEQGAGTARQAHMGDETWSALLLDGSMYAPSWRALTGGGTVWETAQDGTAVEAYGDELDRLMGNYGAAHDHIMYWDEGCIFVGTCEED